MDIRTLFVASDGSRRDEVFFSVPESDWESIIRFLGYVARLNETRFVREQRGGSIGIFWSASGGVTVAETIVDEEMVSALLMRLRPFVLQGEKYHLPTFINSKLNRWFRHPVIQNGLDGSKNRFSLKKLERFKLDPEGRPPLSHDVVMDWLNSFEYHFDDVKRERVNVDFGPFARVQNGLNLALFALVEIVEAVRITGNLVENLQACMDGRLAEIKCPPELFVE